MFMAHIGPTGVMSNFVGFGGENAVEIFFVISGFYIAMILDKSYSSNLGFYKNRALRLYPIYYIICLLVLVRCLIFPSFRTELFSYPGKALAVGTLANSTFFGADWIMFLQWNGNNLNFGNFQNSQLPLWNMLLAPQSWSLGIEVTFYLLAPMLCKAKSITILFLGISLLVARIVAFIMGLNEDPWTYRFFPFELPMFIMGILLYRIKNHYRHSLRISIVKTYTSILFAYLLFPHVTSNSNLGRHFQLLALLILVAVIVLFSAEHPKDKKFGELSYPIYISHLLIISTFNEMLLIISGKIVIFEKLKSPVTFISLTLLLTFLFSFLVLRLVQPIERIREKNRK